MKTPLHQYPRNREQLLENVWQEVTIEHYNEMLGCVPPLRMGGGAFLVGEPLASLDTGEVVYTACVQFGDRFFSRPEISEDWNPNRYKKQAIIDNTPTKETKHTPEPWSLVTRDCVHVITDAGLLT